MDENNKDIGVKTISDFKRMCEKEDINYIKSFEEAFFIVCKKCNSTDCFFITNEKQYGCGSPQTGMYTREEGSIVFKCKNCGNAKIIKNE